ncbi:MAG: hypothetical protein GY945_11485 [Rhodobacteraceae bacterium]|nr:hypothetical protein [Paracoccaceae bacterium]
MATDFGKTEQERNALRWGGLSGILGSITLIVVFGIVAVFVGTETLEPEAMVQLFPSVKLARIFENSLYLLSLALWIFHCLTLFLALRTTSLASALFGSTVLVLGLVALVTGAIPHTATEPISDLYNSAATTPESRAALVPIWQATQGIFDALLVTGLVLTPVGIIFLGLAMLGNPDYGRGFGATSLLLGLAGFAAAIAVLNEPTEIAAVGIFALIFFNIIVGWKTFRLSNST